MVRNHTIKNLAEVVAAKAARPEVMKPQKVNGRWHSAKMTGKAIATLRKKHIMSGKEWKWDIPHKIVEKKVEFKGKKRDLHKVEKQAEIKKCMERMPQLIADYRKRERERRAKRKLEGMSHIEKMLSTPREHPGVITRE